MQYKVIYDIRQDLGPWWFPVIGFIVTGIALIMFLALKRKQMPPRLGQSRNQAVVLSIVIFVFSLCVSTSSLAFLYSQHQYYQDVMEHGDALIVEGVVENYKPMSNDRGASEGLFESFTVNGVLFQYSDYIIKPGFRNSALLGGPIKAGLKVRIFYFQDIILRLEIDDGTI